MEYLSSKSIVAIDLGSNSLRMILVDRMSGRTQKEFEKTVGTADQLEESGMISGGALERICDALKEGFARFQTDRSPCVAVTTAAMRRAKNSEVILSQIEDRTGVRFSIIDGEEEARLTLLAIQNALVRHDIQGEKSVILDIGGGSCELVVVDGLDSYLQSFPYGIVTLTQSSNKKYAFDQFREAVSDFVSLHRDTIGQAIFVATAGTPTTVCAVKLGLSYATYDKNKINAQIVSLEDLLEVQKTLRSLSREALVEKVGNGRGEYIDTGVEIFKMFYELLDKEAGIVFDDGLREGVVLDFLSKHPLR